MTAPLDLRPPSKPVNLYTGQDCTFRVVGLPTGTYTARQVTGADQTPVGDPLSCTADGADWLVAVLASRRLPHSRIQLADATEVVLELAPTWLARGVPGPATRTVTVTSGASPTVEIVVQDGPSIAVERARAEGAEVALGVRVDAETAARQDEDAVLAAAITSEATSRANADTAEVTNRNAAIAVHAAAIDPHGDRAYTDSRIAAILGGVPPTALDTVIELANQMLADEGVVVTLTTLVGTKETPAGAQAKADAAQAYAVQRSHHTGTQPLSTISDAGTAAAANTGTGAGNVPTVAQADARYQGIGTYLQGLVPTAVKTANYAAAVNDLVPVDTTSGAVTVTLPTAPADGSLVHVKHVIQGGTNTVTIATGGSDVINKAGGVTSMTLTVLAQAALLLYKASSHIWYVVADDLALAQLDARFQAVGAYVVVGSDPWLKAFAANPDLLIFGAITRDSNEAATSAPVVWPDGTTGTYTATAVSAAFPGAVDAYTITYGSPVTKTVTQAAVTRDTNGAVTTRPALTVA